MDSLRLDIWHGQEGKEMAKNIVVFSDGTGQDGGKGPDSNVYKLFKMAQNRSAEQVLFYDRGLGTGWRKISGNAAGRGISKNILECYEFIFDNYSVDDRIYLFGFSRGATTVRSLSGFIHLFGILPKSRPELIKEAYKIYKIGNKQKREAAAKDFVERHHTMWCKIKFLGVWDTVAALGLPIKSLDVIIDKIPLLKHNFHDLDLSKSIENACHALAIDDERLTFHPTLWNPNVEDYQTMKQVWFCGMHSDVGGGYPAQGLSDIALEWMIDNATEHGLKVYGGQDVATDGQPDGEMHNSRGTWLTGLYRKGTRSWPRDTHGEPCIHESVTKRTLNRDNTDAPLYGPWILNEPYKCMIEPKQPTAQPTNPPVTLGG